MFQTDAATLLAIALTFTVAGFVKGVSGMGLPTVAMGLLGAMMPPANAAALLVVPSLVTNLWQMWAGARLGVLARRLALLLGGVVAGTAACIGQLASAGTADGVAGLGVVLMVYAAAGLWAREISVPRRAERWASPVVGLATGAVAGATGVFVMPAVPYLQALGLNKDDLVQALGLSFTVSTLALAAALAGRGALGVDGAAASLLVTLPALAGVWCGQRLRRRISPAAFRRWFLIGLFGLGLELASRPFL